MNFMEVFSNLTKKAKKEEVLESHQIGNQNIYRLHFIDYHYLGDNFDCDGVGVIDIHMKPFELPLGMSREDAFKVLSYLTDVIEKRYDVKAASCTSVNILDNIIDIKRYGFKRVDIELGLHDSKVIDLFTVTGRIDKFKASRYYSKYINWYKEYVSLEEVQQIYKKCGIKFKDLILQDKVAV